MSEYRIKETITKGGKSTFIPEHQVGFWGGWEPMKKRVVGMRHGVSMYFKTKEAAEEYIQKRIDAQLEHTKYHPFNG